MGESGNTLRGGGGVGAKGMTSETSTLPPCLPPSLPRYLPVLSRYAIFSRSNVHFSPAHQKYVAPASTARASRPVIIKTIVQLLLHIHYVSPSFSPPSGATTTQTNQDLRSSQPPRGREPQLMTNLLRPWSLGFPLSFPRRQIDTGSNGFVQPQPQPPPGPPPPQTGGSLGSAAAAVAAVAAAPELSAAANSHRPVEATKQQQGGRAGRGGAVEKDEGYRQPADLQPRPPRRRVLRQHQRGSAAAGDRWGREVELTPPPLLPPLLPSGQHRPRKTVLLRRLRRRRLLKRLLSSSPTGPPR